MMVSSVPTAGNNIVMTTDYVYCNNTEQRAGEQGVNAVLNFVAVLLLYVLKALYISLKPDE